MASPPARPALRARYENRRAGVVARAAHVFAVHGYDQTSVAELTEELGIAAGAFYHYFGAKEDLLEAICDALMEPLLLAARDVDDLRELVRLWVAHVIAHRDHMLVFQQERHVIERGPQWRAVRASRKAFERLVEEALERAGDRLAVPDRRLALSALLGMVNHTAQWYRPRGRLTAAEVADGYVDLLLGPETGATDRRPR